MSVTVFFTKDERNVASDALRSLSLTYSETRGLEVDSVQYTSDHRLARLRRGSRMFHVPTANILMVIGDVEEDE